MTSPIVQISDGKLKGKEWKISNGEEVLAFLGIPYGKPPVGELRFKAPLPAEAWEGIRDATEDGHQCYGPEFFGTKMSGSEDCLFLNVFTKCLQPEKLKPVMVFIHGGCFVIGSGSSKITNPQYLLTEDIVLVGINYRLGILGFLNLEDPSLDIPGNAGLKDQTLALKWIQKNIANFGGDPQNVTVFGISAGSTSAQFHILSPTSKGLMHKGILQSGAVHNPWTYGSAKLQEVLKASGIEMKDEKSALDYVKNLPIEELHTIQDVYMKGLGTNMGIFGPVVEKPNPTAFITQEPVEIIASGNYNKVPVIFGYCNKEGLLYFSDVINGMMGKNFETTFEEDVASHLGLDKESQIFKALMKRFEEFYLTSGMRNGKIELLSDLLFTAGIIASAKLHAATSTTPIYVYRFSFVGKLNIFRPFLKGVDLIAATHAEDSGYLFDSQIMPSEDNSLEKGSPEELTINRMVKMWTDFAKFSNPTPPGSKVGITWEEFKTNSEYYLDIGSDLVLESGPEGKKMPFWKEIGEIYRSHGVKISRSS